MVALTSPPPIPFDADKLSQREAARLLGVSFQTCSRWMTKGRLGVRLPSVPLGGKRVTTRAAIAWWWEAIQVAEAQRRDGIDAEASDNESYDEAAADLEAAADAAGI